MDASRAAAALQSENKNVRRRLVSFSEDDLILRAGGDGHTVCVHSGMVAGSSRVLADVLASTEGNELPLPGKSQAELELLVAWLYHREQFTVVRARRDARCALAD